MNGSFLNLVGNNVCQSVGSLSVGMDAIREHQLLTAFEEAVEVDERKTVLLGFFILVDDKS